MRFPNLRHIFHKRDKWDLDRKQCCANCRHFRNPFCTRYPPVPVVLPGHKDVSQMLAQVQNCHCAGFGHPNPGGPLDLYSFVCGEFVRKTRQVNQ